jgi:hypothetical protein
MRTGDLNAWDWTMLDLVGFTTCTVLRTKTKTPQVLEVPEVLRPFVRAWWERAGRPISGPVFPVRKGPNAGEFKAKRGISYADRLRRDLFRAGVTRMPPIEVPATKPGARTDLGKRVAGTKPAPSPSDPLYFETATTLPVDFHSFRRAFNTALAGANVNVQRAMHLAGHSDTKTHMRYVMQSPAMRAIPAEALPRLFDPSDASTEARGEGGPAVSEAASRGNVRDPDDSSEPDPKTLTISARHRGFEPLAFGSGERRSSKKQLVLKHHARRRPLLPHPLIHGDSQGTVLICHQLPRAGGGAGRHPGSSSSRASP